MRWRLLVVVVLGVTAGCTTLGDGGETTTLTPAPVPSEPPESGPGSTVAPGIWADGRIDAAMLSAAHRAAMANRSFVWRAQRNVTEAIGNTTRETSTRSHLVVENRTRYYRDALSPPNPWTEPLFTRYSEYSNGTDRFVRRDAYEWNRSRYYRAPVTPRGATLRNTTAAPIERYLDVDSVTVTTVRKDNRTVYRIVGDERTGAWGETIRNYTLRALVTPEGIVRSITVSFTFTQPDSVERVHYEAAFERIGNVTAAPPDWLPAARKHAVNGTGAFPN